jgi:hypothetical protein
MAPGGDAYRQPEERWRSRSWWRDMERVVGAAPVIWFGSATAWSIARGTRSHAGSGRCMSWRMSSPRDSRSASYGCRGATRLAAVRDRPGPGPYVTYLHTGHRANFANHGGGPIALYPAYASRNWTPAVVRRWSSLALNSMPFRGRRVPWPPDRACSIATAHARIAAEP